VLIAEGLSCASAILLAAWYPEDVRALLLVDSRPPEDDALLARSLRDCPPEWVKLRAGISGPVLEVTADPLAHLQTLLG
jgi:pimeloyl-ACP methyl ester carboxylesterase